MPLYILVLDKTDPQIWENVRKNWPAPDHHIHDDRVAFVKDNKRLTAEISEKAGIGNKSAGLVIQADYYSGRTSSPLVEWLERFDG